MNAKRSIRDLLKVGLIISVGTMLLVGWLMYRVQTRVHNCITDHTIIAEPAATLWYNRPSTAILQNRLYLAYVGGRVPLGNTKLLRHIPVVEGRLDDFLMRLGNYNAVVTGWSTDGKVASHTQLKSWHSPDDHSAPAIIATDKGLIAAYAHHSSPLFIRTGGPEWAAEQTIETGSATYPRLVSIGGQIALVYARGKLGAEGGRDLVYRTSDDNGNSWGQINMLVEAKPGFYVYASRAVARGRSGFCIAYTMFGRLPNGTESRFGLTVACRDDNGRIERTPIHVDKLGRDILVFDVAMKNDTPRILFTGCADPYDEKKLWSDCPAFVAEQFENRWSFRKLGIMASSTMPGGMSFDVTEPDRIAIVKRIEGKVKIVVLRLDETITVEKIIKPDYFATMPVFTGFSRPSLIWNEMRWFSSGNHHHMQLVGLCGE